MQAYQPTRREVAVTMSSGAGLELFWSLIAVGAAMIGISTDDPVRLAALAIIAISFALFAEGGVLAAGWHRGDNLDDVAERRVIGVNVGGAVIALILGSLALAGVAPQILASIALFVLGGLLVVDAPLEPAFTRPRGRIAGGLMATGGVAAIYLLVAGLAWRGAELIPWAALAIGCAHIIDAIAMLLRYMRNAVSERT